MYYSKIYGHFNYEFLYDEVVERFDSGSVFVEIGAYLGKSTCYLAEKIIESGKNIKFNVIDNWVGDPSDKVLAEEIRKIGDVYSMFLNNMTKAGVLNKLNVVRGDSAKSSSLFENKSIDFVFIDAAHDYVSVKRDIMAWLPKMKLNSILAGHDYNDIDPPEVKMAVHEVLGNQIEVHENVWIYRIG